MHLRRFTCFEGEEEEEEGKYKNFLKTKQKIQ